MARAIGLLAGIVLRLWALSYRVTLVSETLAGLGPQGVFGFWHGRQMALLGTGALRQGVALVSHSRDGALQSGILSSLGVDAVRGSSSRGGARALRELVRRLRARPERALFAVDGPRGPAFVAKPGAAQAAVLARVPLFPVGSAARWVIRVRGAWDDFEIPLPFSRVVVVVGAPLDAARGVAEPQVLELAIRRAGATAAEGLARGRLPCLLGEGGRA
ncbi:MAG: DUF374 domain-containing protein [Myxococcales bacterium]|nr:DUF374 domain-containing protein [Myxococcales bacterium]